MGRKRRGTLIDRDGVWHAQVTVAKGVREWYTLNTGDRNLAQRRLDQLVATLAKGAPRERAETLITTIAEVKQEWGSFREYAAEWVKARKDDEVVSARDEERNLTAYVLPHIGNIALSGVQTIHVKGVLEKAGAAGLSRETVRKIRGVTGRIFKQAVADGKITQSPVGALPNQKRGGKSVKAAVKKRRTILTDEEIRTYLSTTEKVDAELQLMSLVARCEGGMRTGDVNQWDWSHITTTDFKTCVIPRSKADDPQVMEIPDVLRGRLRARWIDAGRPESGPVFPARRGANKGGFRVKRGISFAARLRRDLKRAGIARHEVFHETATTLPVDFHSFRRAFNTALATVGINVQRAMRLAGHSDERTHMRYVMDVPAMRQIPVEALPQLDDTPRPETGATTRRLLRSVKAHKVERRREARRAPATLSDSATGCCDSVVERAGILARHARFEPATFGSGGRRGDPVCAANQITDRRVSRSLRDEIAGAILFSDHFLQHIATALADPVAMLEAFISRRGREARVCGLALAWRVRAMSGDERLAALADAVLRGGEHGDARMLDLVEALADVVESPDTMAMVG